MHPEKFKTLLSAADTSTDMALNFVNNVFSEGQSRSFYSPITRSKLEAFEAMTSKTSLKCRSGEVVSGRVKPGIVFRRTLML